MNKILVIKANPKEDSQSRTFQLLNVFLDEYKKNNSDDEITILNLYQENIINMDSDLMKKISNNEDNISKKHAEIFAQHDKYIFAAPMWNLTFPAILKSYIDFIVYNGISFAYTQKGPMGLLSNKERKALHIVTRGGDYSTPQMKNFEFGDSYLKSIIQFIGVKSFESLVLEGVNMVSPDKVEPLIKEANKKAIELAKKF